MCIDHNLFSMMGRNEKRGEGGSKIMRTDKSHDYLEEQDLMDGAKNYCNIEEAICLLFEAIHSCICRGSSYIMKWPHYINL